MNDNLKDKTIICKDCGEEFIFKAKITENDFPRLDVKEGEKLLSRRTFLKEKVENLISSGKSLEVKEFQEELNMLENMIVFLSNGNSQEAYSFYEFTNESARCPDCRRKIQENRISRSR